MGLFFFGVLLTLCSLFLMLLVLVQRGKGGGLTGALGGMGGQSAFGARAGDAFTKITTITAIVWITLCMLTIAMYNPPPREIKTDRGDEQVPADISGAMTAGEEETGESEDGGDTDPAADAAGDQSDANVIDMLGGEDSKSPPDDSASGTNEQSGDGQSGENSSGTSDGDTGNADNSADQSSGG